MKKQKSKKKSGKVIKGVGVLAIIALLLGLDPMGWGISDKLGFGTGDNQSEQSSDDKQNDSSNDVSNEVSDVTATPEATPTPAEEQNKEPETVELKVVEVEVKANKILYNGAEAESAQKLTEQLTAEYTELKDIIVKINVKEAVFDTVEELKLALGNSGINYEIVE